MNAIRKSLAEGEPASELLAKYLGDTARQHGRTVEEQAREFRRVRDPLFVELLRRITQP